MKIQPLHDKVLIRAIEQATKTGKGILTIPDSAKEKQQEGDVVAVGPGRFAGEGSDARLPMSIAVGDRVLFAKYSGIEIKVDGEGLLLLDESDIIAIVRK